MQAPASPAKFAKLIHKHTQPLQDPKHAVTVAVVAPHDVVVVGAVIAPRVVSRLRLSCRTVSWSRLGRLLNPRRRGLSNLKAPFVRGGAAVEGSVEVEAFIVVEVENGLLCCSVSGVMSCLVLPAPFPLRVHGLCQSMPSLCPPWPPLFLRRL